MKRSQVDAAIDSALEFFAGRGFLLPPYAYYSVGEWRGHVDDIRAFRDLKLGWDVTAFGGADFTKTGLLLFTLRNGMPGNADYPKPYAEKIMMVLENQITPLHFHWRKREDIINRGGGNLVIELFHADPKRNCLTGENFTIEVDGVRRTLKSGDKLILQPGQSVCFEPCHAHRFYGEAGHGPVLAGEVSMVNDDSGDNCFIEGTPRFDRIEEDVPARHVLAMEYDKWLK